MFMLDYCYRSDQMKVDVHVSFLFNLHVTHLPNTGECPLCRSFDLAEKISMY
jgi:hypothetical protein